MGRHCGTKTGPGSLFRPIIGKRDPGPVFRVAAAIGVALIALACYHFTLLPGLDFGDTASFQTGVGSINLTPRQAYPLYYGLGNMFAWIVPGEPAHALNVASAVYGALAAAVITWIAIELTGLPLQPAPLLTT